MLERQARGPIAEEQAVATSVIWALEPATQTKTQNGLDISLTHATMPYLNKLFNNKQVFGGHAGLNPYFREQLVFYVRIANHTGKRVRIEPDRFVLLDDRGSQYHFLSPDYGTALAESKAPVATTTRGILDDARPGYFGVGLPVGKIIGKPQQRFALLELASLQAGDIYDGVVYDGLIAFWSPHWESQKLKLILGGIKTNFDAADLPQAVLEFVFECAASHPK
ncbi:MAG: hypothetical protein HY596_04750 [Candidatus Omnitrophica bacterium]|nr:hypothetical protein [Candidatus Omnitrophota bacterium]